uniref:Uncharacterized protein n=1 Tax=Sphaerodactylus townsendi TaxID=933632 RepID=A0ACB8FKP4_9SAUR
MIEVGYVPGGFHNPFSPRLPGLRHSKDPLPPSCEAAAAGETGAAPDGVTFKCLMPHENVSPDHVQEILGDQPEVKEKMFTILKQYAAERKVDYLAYALAMVLTKESQHLLLDNIS